MVNFRIKIGNIVADVQSNHNYIKEISSEYLSNDPSNYSVKIDDAVITRERFAISAELNTSEADSSHLEDWFLEVYALLHGLLPILPEYNMLFLHGSAIKYGNKAYMFIAPSGTGKSTHSRLWKERFGDDVTVINDDKPFLTFDDNLVYVCGTPWRGKHNIGGNFNVELGGICILSRGETNRIARISPADAMNDVIKQSNLQSYKDNKLLALDLIQKLLDIVPTYRLFCKPDLDAVDVCFNEIVK